MASIALPSTWGEKGCRSSLFGGLYLESYRVIPKRSYQGAYGSFRNQSPSVPYRNRMFISSRARSSTEDCKGPFFMSELFVAFAAGVAKGGGMGRGSGGVEVLEGKNAA